MKDSQSIEKARNSLPLYSLFAANAISLVGNVFTTIAIPWFVLQTTGSATKTGITGFFNILPVVLAGFLGGTIVDRLGYKRTSVISDLASGVTTALVPLLYFTIGMEFWQLMVLVFLGAFLDTPGSTARAALLPELAEQAQMSIPGRRAEHRRGEQRRAAEGQKGSRDHSRCCHSDARRGAPAPVGHGPIPGGR